MIDDINPDIPANVTDFEIFEFFDRLVTGKVKLWKLPLAVKVML